MSCRPSGTGPVLAIQMAHRDPYDHAITTVGLRLTEIGYPYSTRAHELARANLTALSQQCCIASAATATCCRERLQTCAMQLTFR